MAVDSYFQAIQNKVGKDMSFIMLYGDGSFLPSSKDEDSVPTGSEKAFLTRNAREHRTSSGGLFCQKSDLVPVPADGRVQENSTSLDWRRCTACHLAEEAGRGEGTARIVMQKDRLAAMNTRRRRIAAMKGKKQPYALQNAKCLL